MIHLVAACLALTLLSTAAFAAPPSSADPQALADVNRLLEDEIKLAARPQIYLILDPFERVLLIKSRGLELFRFPVDRLAGPDPRSLSGVYRLRARPPVKRPKAAPVDDPEQLAVIELKDMPDAYELAMDPELLVLISPPAREHPRAWIVSHMREWWSRLVHRGRRHVRLTVSEEAARSVAWSVTESMPLLIGRTRDR